MTCDSTAKDVARLLALQGQRLVLAESCTAGMIAASLGSVPGISQHFCGSAVVYRERTKMAWLEIDPGLLRQFSDVSPQVTQALARNVLERTDEATLALGITGHLGPDAPVGQDGVVHIAVCLRRSGGITDGMAQMISLKARERTQRQAEATLAALTILKSQLLSERPAAD